MYVYYTLYVSLKAEKEGCCHQQLPGIGNRILHTHIKETKLMISYIILMFILTSPAEYAVKHRNIYEYDVN